MNNTNGNNTGYSSICSTFEVLIFCSSISVTFFIGVRNSLSISQIGEIKLMLFVSPIQFDHEFGGTNLEFRLMHKQTK